MEILYLKIRNGIPVFLIASDYLKIHHGELFVDSTDIDRIKVYTIVLLLGTSHYSLNELVTLDRDKPVSMLPLAPILGNDKAYARVEVAKTEHAHPIQAVQSTHF